MNGTIMNGCQGKPEPKPMIKKCPNCGEEGEGVRFERIRRITGYLVGTLDRFNDAKAKEVKERVRHGLK